MLFYAEEKEILGGYDDGFIRNFILGPEKSGKLNYELVNAHRGKVSSIYCVFKLIRMIIISLVEEKIVL